ncbi:MAG: hypothetical protein IKQ55_11610 [Kiritimatiellae bacterium]|nr:hypothetical protein [Kiritimatiellia bacterium]
MIGKKFSNGWKNPPIFSNDWKNFSPVFQRLEKIFGRPTRPSLLLQATKGTKDSAVASDAWKKESGLGRDGGSTAGGRRGKRDSAPAMNESSPLGMDHAEAGIDGHPQYSPRRPFH